MTLNLLLEQTGKSWTLKNNREYVVGSGKDCDISLPNSNLVSEHHIKFSFDNFSNTWHILDLGSGRGTFVNNQSITDYSIQTLTKIVIAGSVVLVATPETQPVAQSPHYAPPPPVYNSTPQNIYPHASQQHPSQQHIGGGHSFPMSIPISMLTWKEYVDQQVQQQPNIMARIATRFYLITGFRNTPWLQAFAGYGKGGNNNFNAFDGYILPDFHESASTVATVLEEKIGQLKQYEDTDCYVTRLTDAHIVDSNNQSFLGVELFPVYRGKRPQPDYRKFCVVSYHRVRIYLLVENYGTDLFVSWVTRFEPQPNFVSMILWLILAIVLSLLGLLSGNLLALLLPLTIWSDIYLFVPAIMQTFGILPKKANALLVSSVLVVITMLLFGGLLLFAAYLAFK